eukprot:15050705-Ditylum_brightwellii.AAC.1
MGTAPWFDEVDEYTQAYLDQLVSIKGHLPDKAELIPFPDFQLEDKRLREKTSSGPSDVTPAMIKTEVEDDYLAQIGWH